MPWIGPLQPNPMIQQHSPLCPFENHFRITRETSPRTHKHPHNHKPWDIAWAFLESHHQASTLLLNRRVYKARVTSPELVLTIGIGTTSHQAKTGLPIITEGWRGYLDLRLRGSQCLHCISKDWCSKNGLESRS